MAKVAERTVESSDLGWAPGHWPRNVRSRDGRIWRRDEPIFAGRGEDRELAGYRYRADDGDRLTVWND